MGKIVGNDFMVWVGTGATKTVVGGSKTATFKDQFEKINADSRDGKYTLLAPGEYTIEVGGLVDFVATGSTQNTTSLAQIYKSKLPVNWSMGSASGSTIPQTLDTGKKYISGVIKFDTFSISSDFKGVVEYTMTATGQGDWSLI